MRSVCMVGFSNKTLSGLEDCKADEYWSMNHIVFISYVNIPRYDRLFEIHKRTWYLRAEQEKRQMYDEWLRKEHPFPIYMQESELDKELVPSGVRYPFDEICDELLPGLKKRRKVDDNPEELVALDYFTSSAAFMFALAIYEKFDRIEIFGIDMDSDTEYGYQRPCGEFWLGMALGKGMKVILHENSNLCSAPLYGYEIVPYIDKAHVITILEDYQDKHKKRKFEMDKAAKKLTANPDNQNAVDKYLLTSAWVYLHEGAISACARLIQKDDSYISRQILEIARVSYVNGLEYWKSQANNIKGKIETVGRENVDDNEWRNYLNARASMFANLGASQVHKKLEAIIDFRSVNMDLTMDIVEGE